MSIRAEIKKFVAQKKREAKLPDVRKKLHRLAELNCAHCMVPPRTLTAAEEVERDFLQKTLPHVTNIGEIEDLLKRLPKR